jgi:hypothetical protein
MYYVGADGVCVFRAMVEPTNSLAAIADVGDFEKNWSVCNSMYGVCIYWIKGKGGAICPPRSLQCLGSKFCVLY